MFFFFFQAEDGIRDIGVTGVQTCALPISWLMLDTGLSRTGLARGGGPIAVEPGAREARVEHQPRGIAVDHPEIGRASCREREEMTVVARLVKQKIVRERT